MIRKILFIASILTVGFASAQSLQLMDHNDNDIDGTTHVEVAHNASLADLAAAKFHIKNLTGSLQEFVLKVSLEYTGYQGDLGVCFGTQCYLYQF